MKYEDLNELQQYAVDQEARYSFSSASWVRSNAVSFADGTTLPMDTFYWLVRQRRAQFDKEMRTRVPYGLIHDDSPAPRDIPLPEPVSLPRLPRAWLAGPRSTPSSSWLSRLIQRLVRSLG